VAKVSVRKRGIDLEFLYSKNDAVQIGMGNASWKSEESRKRVMLSSFQLHIYPTREMQQKLPQVEEHTKLGATHVHDVAGNKP
jgi:hypothetical protein